ncbi:hypothetical protein MOOR_18180 [Moorella thermoacetica]|uniref:IS3 family transposase n=1 Tax=Neomoorella thermoacetica TaxID=1525 RepID=A0A1J5JT77_NEOTH|nr:hypothetical protein MOOR_18180 [Moorella thermoacetica]
MSSGDSPGGTGYLKKSCGHLLQNAEMKYRFIREHTGTFRVETMYRVLKVSRTGYYRWLNSALGYETPEEFEKNYENLIKVA